MTTVPPTERPCTKCGITKPLSEYYKDKHSADGYRRDCRECGVKRTIMARNKRKAEGPLQALSTIERVVD